jgi:hypothetical protein
MEMTFQAICDAMIQPDITSEGSEKLVSEDGEKARASFEKEKWRILIRPECELGTEKYYGSLFHELIHFARADLRGECSSSARAYEEYVAEVATLCMVQPEGVKLSPEYEKEVEDFRDKAFLEM